MQTYPVILRPAAIEAILSEFPPTPPLPELQPAPILKLREKPVSPITLPRPEHPGNFAEIPPQKIAFVPLVVGEIIITFVAAFLGGVSNNSIVGPVVFIFLTAVLGCWGHIDYESYPEKLQIYRQKQIAHENAMKNYPQVLLNWEQEREEQLQKYKQELQAWEFDAARENKKHQEQMKQWESKKDELERIYQRQVAEWRYRQIRQRMLSLNPSPLGNEVDTTDSDPRGYAEFSRNCSFSTKLKNYFGNKIYVLRYLSNKIPDFSYIDTSKNLHINIEIDEPYTPRKYPNSEKSLEVTHCIEQEHYSNRDKYFTSLDWFVIHSSEKQVICQTDSCCKQIAQLIYELTGDESVLRQFNSVLDLQSDACWTEKQAQAMAYRQERLNYKCCASKHIIYK